jgi:hypothetical protein
MLFLSPFIWNPNEHAFAFGGDPFVIYYDMFYHICYGDGLTLKAMNYPWYEMIFLTDMQGALSLVLNWIHLHVFSICEYTVGITHLVVILLWPLTSIFLYLIFRHFKLPVWLSFVAALLICFLSPQLPRISGHFGLAYGFIIPACIYWYLKWYINPRVWSALILLIVLSFFCFNNPYIGFASCSILIIGGSIRLLFDKKLRTQARNWIPVCIGVIPLLLFFLSSKLLDPIDDRIEMQWGFFSYSTKIKGLLTPSDSLLQYLVSFFHEGKLLPIESQTNLGLVPIFLGVFLFIRFLSKPKLLKFDFFRSEFGSIILASFLLLLFAMNFPFYGSLKTIAESHLGPLLMFKASGRFSWPFYYLFEIAIVVWLWRTFLSKRKNFKIGFMLFIFTSISIWAIEDYRYMDYHLSNKTYDNPLHMEKLSEINAVLDQHEISPHDFQAIYVVPIMQAWTDKMLTKLYWPSHFHGMRLSAATGLPMINAMLSRMSVSQTLLSMQFASNSVINKELLDFLEKDKPVLLLKGGIEPPLTEGERYLISKAEPLFISDNYSLYKLDLNTIISSENGLEKKNEFQALVNEEVDFPVYFSKYEDSHWIHETFDHLNTKEIFYGAGALEIVEGFPTCWEKDQIDLTAGDYEVSIWTKVDNLKYGLPKWWLNGYDKEGVRVFSNSFSTRDARDIQHFWVRASAVFTLPENTYRLELKAETNQKFYTDEFWILPAKEEVFYKDQESSDSFLWNNFKIE